MNAPDAASIAIVLCGTLGVALLVAPPGRAGSGASVPRSERWQERWVRWLAGAGLGDARPGAVAVGIAAFAVAAGMLGYAVFGGALPAAVAATFAVIAPVAAQRQRRRSRLGVAEEAWPQMIDEIRIMIAAAGRPIPHALLDVGCRGPVELRDAFEAARREWSLSTDFDRTVAVLTARLGSPVADATCETLLVAYSVGSTDLERRLTELAEDRRLDNLARKEARAKQAGVRFARRFVILVPLGMAAAGLSLGNGRAAYQTTTGQVLVSVGLGLVALCWWWSGRILRLPEEQRVLG